jgi:predicted transcriptional regulator
MASSTTVRVSEATHAALKELAERTQTSMSVVIELALVEYDKRLFWEQARRELEQLRADDAAWRDEQDEVAVWDVSLADGLDLGDEG